MKDIAENFKKGSHLLITVEQILQKAAAEKEGLGCEDALQLIHELQVYQLELEMQNEELRRTQHDLEKSNKQFTYLYDYTSLGYLTLSPSGNIATANTTIAHLLNLEKSQIIGKRWGIEFSHLPR